MKVITAVIILSLMPLVAIAQRAGDGGATTLSVPGILELVKSYRVLDVTWDPRLPRFDELSLVNDILGPSVAGAVAKEKLGVAPEEATKFTRVRVRQNSIEIIVLASEKTASGAREYADAIVSRLPALLAARADQAFTQLLDQTRASQDIGREELKRVAAEMSVMREKLRKETGQVDISTEGLRESISKLEQERQKLELEMIANAARRKALEQAIAEVSRKAEARIKDDPIAAEFERMLVLRQQALERSRELVKTGQMSSTELGAAEAQLIEARAKLLERREVASRLAGGDALAELNRELLNLSIGLAETEARRDYVEKALAGYRNSTDLADEIERLRAERSRISAIVAEQESRLLNLRLAGPTLGKPTMRVVDSRDQ